MVWIGRKPGVRSPSEIPDLIRGYPGAFVTAYYDCDAAHEAWNSRLLPAVEPPFAPVYLDNTVPDEEY